MTYLIYEQDELVEVLDFETPQELNAYKSTNPFYRLELADENSLIPEEDEDDEFDEFELW